MAAVKSSVKEEFCNITMTGRICYIFMCIERYLTALYPERDWTPIAKRMWQWTTHWWNESSDIYAVAVPEFILEFEGYEKTNEIAFDGCLSKRDYDEITALFKGITHGDGTDEMCRVLMIPIDFGCICEGTSVKGAGPLVAELIEETEDILKKHDIPFPDKGLLKRFEYDRDKPVGLDEKEPGWGDNENTEDLSIILGHTE